MNRSDVFTIVADPDRRQILRTVLDDGGRTTVDDLSTRLVRNRRASGDVNELERTKIELIHNHLPRLQDHGVIEYDRESGRVDLDSAENLKPYLRAAST